MESSQTPSIESMAVDETTEDENPTPSRPESELHENIRIAIERTRGMKVQPDDPLGEGDGFFDSDPRIPTDTIDCMTWLQWVLAMAYSSEDSDPLRWMDTLRYYGGNVGFDTRKHYVDRWLWMDPGPLRPLPCDSEDCPSETIELQLDGVPRAHDYPCSLWREEVSSIEFRSFQPNRLPNVLKSLEPGFYVIFGVANDRYLSLYGQDSGPMGQVHPALLEITDEHIEITHASTVAGAIDTLSLTEWIENSRTLHRGTTLYSLDPDWDPESHRLPIGRTNLCPRR